MITAFWTIVNITWVANPTMFSSVSAWGFPSTFLINWHTVLEEDPVTHFVVLPDCQEDVAMFRDPLNILSALIRQRNTCTLCWPLEACESVNIQDKAKRLMVTTGHIFKNAMANYQPGIAGEVAGKSSNTMWASRHSWRKYRVDLICATSAGSSSLSAMRTYSGILVDPSHALRHGDVRIGEPRHPTLQFSSLLFSSYTLTTFHRLVLGLNSDMIVKDPPLLHMFRMCHFAAT